jgi:tetratricopeptide (TPR) repeat protein
MNDSAAVENDVPADAASAPDRSAAWAALGAASRERADAFLEAQTAVAKLQKEHLHEQRQLLISHLKWRRFDDWMRSGWQAMLFIVGVIAIAAIATALWDASRANGLVVDAFTVPPAFEQRGVGGDVIATDMTERLDAIRAIAIAHSYSNTEDVSQNRTNEIKVEIPDTGISLAEVWRYLRRWLGHERHVTGSLRETPEGKIILIASMEGGQAFSASGRPSDLPDLEQAVAENVFGEFDPVNHVNYLATTGRRHAAYEAAARFTAVADTPILHADSYGLWSYTTAETTGDIRLALQRAEIGIGIDPDLAVVHMMAIRLTGILGHDEDQLREARIVLTLKEDEQTRAHQGAGFAAMQAQSSATIGFLTGDYASAVDRSCADRCAESLLSDAAVSARLHDISRAKALLLKAIAVGGAASRSLAEARANIDIAEGDWQSAIANESEARTAWRHSGSDVSPRFLVAVQATSSTPIIAEADARAGRSAAAHAEIDKTPGDCVACNTVRGNIDALENKPGGAAWWLARAISEGPSIPFAYADWGVMLLHRGDYNGAIAKFALAHAKGPHFADPLELWGEALMQENRSDLALAKFEDANKYAPYWGRLHLEWGKALMYLGHRTEAQQQFADASHLDLSASDSSALARWRAKHV